MFGRLSKCSSTGSEIDDKELMSEDITSGGAGVIEAGVADLADGERRLAELDGGLRDVRDVGFRNGAVAPELGWMSISTRSLTTRPVYLLREGCMYSQSPCARRIRPRYHIPSMDLSRQNLRSAILTAVK